MEMKSSLGDDCSTPWAALNMVTAANRKAATNNVVIMCFLLIRLQLLDNLTLAVEDDTGRIVYCTEIQIWTDSFDVGI